CPASSPTRRSSDLTRQLLGHVEGDDVLPALLPGGDCCDASQLHGSFLGRHVPGFPRGSVTCDGCGTYRRYLLTYCTTPSGTKYQIGSPAATRSRQSVDEIASAGISTIVIRSLGRPSVLFSLNSWPGR